MANEHMRMRPAAGRLGLAVCVAAGLAGAAGALADDEAVPDANAAPALVPPPVHVAAAVPSPAELEQRHATIGQVAIHVDNIFDEDDPRENKLLYRWANDLHIHTRDSTVREQLLFRVGDPYSAQRAEETARNLRQRDYLSEAEVIATAYDPETNTVDLTVRVRDVWTLEPGIGFGRTGGTNKSRIRVADENFLGFGQNLALEYKSNVDRSGLGVEFTDPNVFQSWWGLTAHYANNSDGRIYSAAVAQPFYSLDSRWSLGFAGQSVEQVTPLYDLGETVTKFNSKYDGGGIQGGISDGLVNGWTRRWLAGYRYDRARFGPAPDEPPPLLVPEDRTLSYPWIGMELIQNNFVTTENQDQIGRTEDVFLGERLQASIGWSTPAFGGDGSAGIYSFTGDMGRPVGKSNILLLNASWTGRYESGSTVDSVVDGSAEFYHRFSEKQLFVMKLGATHAQSLDLDQQLQLGGDNGLRGYPLRYQTGDTRFLATFEERYYTNWFPWRLFRIGGAVFADVGRMWGEAPLASAPIGWLSDVGFGLRIGNARSGIGSVLHIDLAFPIGAPNDIASTQVLIEAEKSF